MADEHEPPGSPPPDTPPAAAAGPDLRTVLARLREIERKSRALGQRSELLAELEPRISQVIEALEAREASADPGPGSLHALARQLYAVQQGFESLGFTTLGRELRYVERSLEELEPAPVGDAGAPAPTPPPAPLPPPPQWGVEPATDPLPWHERWRPTPVLMVLVIAFLAAAAGAWLVIQRHREQLDARTATLLAPPPTATPEPTPTPPPPTPTRPPADASNRDTLPAEVGAAQIAVRRGELDDAIEHLSAAARIDPRHQLVLDTAAEVVAALIEDSDRMADRARWEAADETLERARRTALRFELDEAPIEAARRRHAAMPRIDIVRPFETDRLARLVGREVEIIVRTGPPVDGVVSSVGGGVVGLRRAKEVRGGLVYYQDEVQLSAVVEIRAQPAQP